MVQHVFTAVAAGMSYVGFDQPPDVPDVLFLVQRFQIHHLLVAQSGKDTLFIQHIGDAAAHARGEVAAHGADHHHAAAGHVLATVVADALDDGLGAAVADGETLAGTAAEEGLAAGGAVEGHVADDDVLRRIERRVLRRVHRHESAGQALAGIVVRLPFEVERDTPSQEGPEALSRRTEKVDPNGVLRQSLLAVTA